jgi:hypothetical protein
MLNDFVELKGIEPSASRVRFPGCGHPSGGTSLHPFTGLPSGSEFASAGRGLSRKTLRGGPPRAGGRAAEGC